MPNSIGRRDMEGKPTPRKRLALAAAALAALALAVFMRRPETQSRFLTYREGESLVFLDKSLPKERREEVLRERGSRTDAFLAALGYAKGSVANLGLVLVAVNGDYGALAADDPVLSRTLAGRPSAELRLLARMARDFFANEPVARSNISADGRYIFLDARGEWEAAWIHALAHALAVGSLGPRARSRVVAGEDPERFAPREARGWEFLQESAALLTDGLYALSGGMPGRLAQAAAAYGPSGAARFAPDGPVRTELALRDTLAFPPPARDADWYAACQDFGAFLLSEWGSVPVAAFLRLVLSGDWESLDDLVRPFGSGFEALIDRWSEGRGLPPYRRDS